MAIFQLGTIVTNIVGSIGGTTFKRGASNKIVSRKSNGAAKSVLYSNKKIGPIASIFQRWKGLPLAIRGTWNAAAPLYLFPDKFGVERALTGRQLFNKLNIQLLPVNSSVLYGDDLSSIVATVDIDNFDLTISPFKAELQIAGISEETWVLVQIEVSKNKMFAPIFSRRKCTAFAWLSGAGGFDVTEQILQQFPFIDSSYNIRAFVTAMNYFGFKGAPVFKDGIWIS